MVLVASSGRRRGYLAPRDGGRLSSEPPRFAAGSPRGDPNARSRDILSAQWIDERVVERVVWGRGEPRYRKSLLLCGRSSVGRASASQAEGRRFETGRPLSGKRCSAWGYVAGWLGRVDRVCKVYVPLPAALRVWPPACEAEARSVHPVNEDRTRCDEGRPPEGTAPQGCLASRSAPQATKMRTSRCLTDSESS